SKQRRDHSRRISQAETRPTPGKTVCVCGSASYAATVRAHVLAFDLGAESGRAILGRLRSGVLDVHEVCRFSNEPVRQQGSLRWDILRLWLEVQRALERVSDVRLDSVGLDAWGCDYALIGERGDLLENPYHYRDARTDGIQEAVFARVPRDEIYAVTGIQFLSFNT